MNDDKLVTFHARRSHKIGDDIYSTEVVIVLPPDCEVEDIVQAVTTALSIEHHYITTSNFEADKASSAERQAQASPRQVQFMVDLAGRLGAPDLSDALEVLGYEEPLSRDQASEVIDILKGHAEAGTVPEGWSWEPRRNGNGGNGHNEIKNPDAEMTPRQYRFIRGLGKRLGLETEEEVADYLGTEAMDNARSERIFRMTKGKASEAIEAMQVAIQVQEEADAAAAELQLSLPEGSEDPLVQAAVERYGAQVGTCPNPLEAERQKVIDTAAENFGQVLRLWGQILAARQKVIDTAAENFGYDPDKARERAVAFVQKTRPGATWDDLTREELQAVVQAMIMAKARAVSRAV